MPSLDELLADLEREDLVRVLTELAVRHPEAAPTLAALCQAARSAAARRRPLPPPNLAEIQTGLRRALQAPAARYLGGISGALAAETAQPWIERAAAYQASGNPDTALDLLAILADELAEAGDAFRDSGGELHHCLSELGRRLAQSLRATELSPGERHAWTTRLRAWSIALGPVGGASAFHSALEALAAH